MTSKSKVTKIMGYISRCLANSQMTMPAVVLTLRECLVPNWGISMGNLNATIGGINDFLMDSFDFVAEDESVFGVDS